MFTLGATQGVASLSGSALSTVNFIGNSVLNVGTGSNLSTTYAGGFTGAGVLVKTGSTTLTLGNGPLDTTNPNVNTGLSFNFRDSCRRHDFGYRNLQLLERRYGNGASYWNGTNRHRADQQFLADMRSHCRTRAFTLRPSCFTWAQTFYAAVRVAGGP